MNSGGYQDAMSRYCEKHGYSYAEERCPSCVRYEQGAFSYTTVVVDPPWPYDQGWPTFKDSDGKRQRTGLPYKSLPIKDIAAIPVSELANINANLFLWTTNRYIEQAIIVSRVWGFSPSQILTWCKRPRGIGPGGTFSNTSEFVVFAKRGRLPQQKRVDSSWWEWPRGKHSEKPEAFFDLVESVSPGPYLEMFARRKRLGWDVWGDEVDSDVELVA